MSGWISIERDLFKNEFFASEPMSEREAWVWMIANASYADTRHRVGGEMFPVPRGSFMRTLRELMTAFGWKSDTKVRNFLKRLENDEMITRSVVGSRNAPKTHVTICKYNEYQSQGRTENAPKTHEKRTENAVKKQGNKVTIEEPKGSLGDLGFSEFWEIWPSKQNKQNAVKAWKKLSIEDRREAYSAIKGGWFDRWCRSKPDANPIHAATFLNSKRWSDQFQEPQLKTISGGRDERRQQGSAVNNEIATRFANGTFQHDPFQ